MSSLNYFSVYDVLCCVSKLAFSLLPPLAFKPIRSAVIRPNTRQVC